MTAPDAAGFISGTTPYEIRTAWKLTGQSGPYPGDALALLRMVDGITLRHLVNEITDMYGDSWRDLTGPEFTPVSSSAPVAVEPSPAFWERSEDGYRADGARAAYGRSTLRCTPPHGPDVAGTRFGRPVAT